jgi:hypothetical protein
MVYDSPDVYNLPPGYPCPKLLGKTISGMYTRNMLENRLCVTQDTDTEWGMDINRSRGKVFGQT